MLKSVLEGWPIELFVQISFGRMAHRIVRPPIPSLQLKRSMSAHLLCEHKALNLHELKLQLKRSSVADLRHNATVGAVAGG